MKIKLTNTHVRSEFNEKFPLTGLKLQFLADAINVNYQNLSKWRANNHEFSQNMLHKIQNYLDTLPGK